jgi:hypothetical protein
MVISNYHIYTHFSALDAEGLYRISAFKNALETFKSSVDSGEVTDFNTSQIKESSIITGTLKTFLRMLPVPLLTFDLFRDLVNTMGKKVRIDSS